MLSRPLLEGLAVLLRTFQVYGHLGERLEQLVIRQIPKTAGPGHRPIALFTTVFRVWARARAEILRDWARGRLDHPRWNNFNGRRPGDRAWRDLIRAELAEDDGRITVAVTMGISKMFDRIDHSVL